MGICWANVPSELSRFGQRCKRVVDDKDLLGLCPSCRVRLSDTDAPTAEVTRPAHDGPNTPRADAWAREAGLI